MLPWVTELVLALESTLKIQKDNLLEWRTVLNNVFLGLEIQKNNTPENKKYVVELLKK